MSTKVDAVPTEWNVQRIQEFAECTAGGTPSTKISDYWGGKIRWMNSSELHLKRVRDVEGRITETGLRESSARMLPRGCVLVGLAGQGKTRGTVAINLVPLSTNQSVAAILPNKSFVNEYLYHNLDYRYDELREISSGGGGRGGLNLSIIQSLEIPVPNLLEQETIAQILSDMDALLDGLDRLIAKKRDIKQAVMQQLLTGRTRLPGFTGGWMVRRLGEIASIRNEKTLPINVEPSTLCVELDHISRDSGKLLERAGAKDSKSSKYCFYTGDVLFGRLRPYLHKFWLASVDGICTTEIWPLVPDADIVEATFLYAIVQSDQFINAASISYGTHMPRADFKVIQDLEIPIPTMPEQEAIGQVLCDMDAEISALEARRDKTQNLKRATMQELLTGRIRLVDPEATDA